MFWTEEDIQPAVDMSVEMFGKIGNMSQEKSVMKNVVITSNKFGHLWYGDIKDTMESITKKCASIAQKFDMNVRPVNMN